MGPSPAGVSPPSLQRTILSTCLSGTVLGPGDRDVLNAGLNMAYTELGVKPGRKLSAAVDRNEAGSCFRQLDPGSQAAKSFIFLSPETDFLHRGKVPQTSAPQLCNLSPS